jgi:hypothetical protein
MIVTSNKPFGRWGEVFGDDVVAAAMIDRLVHHAEVISLKGDSYRLKDRDLGRVPAAPKPTTRGKQPGRLVRIQPEKMFTIGPELTLTGLLLQPYFATSPSEWAAGRQAASRRDR